ncbi:major facilitator superfamily domain-containing protein [Leucosporidium creatinivorum]|uniref:Major facilitator superfamily domain-containing protein n=1 Tax=Leucosporidium creatinivorum TaxID=106004 RepID=A0A1Y2ETW7_9BASI|nr:major facilitator superfamily domain-containing protein [Leucosporidium creatinivorum]
MSETPATITTRRGLGKVATIFACGTALFSDGYQNNIVGSVNTILRKLYGDLYAANNHATLFSSMGFAGTVLGMLTWGYISDKFGRKSGMMSATTIIVVFAILQTGAYGAGGSITGMLQALIAYRFLIGIGIGAEYPAGSVACAESTEDPAINQKHQHRLFVLASNTSIDVAFVVSAFVPLVLLWICGQNHLRLHVTRVWRLCFGVGIVPPLLIFFIRLGMSNPVRYQQSAITKVRTPYWLALKRYWRSFVGLSLCWFLYDMISYPFGLYSSTIVDIITGGDEALTTTFAWNVVINAFYLPGCIAGAFLVDWLKPKRQMIIFLLLQAVFGFFMSGFYSQLTQHVAGFAVMYGLFLSMGEAGPGDCLGLLASKLWPTAVRGQMYGVAAAVGKIGAFVGTWAFPAIINDFPAGDAQTSGPFWIGSGMAILSALIIFFLVPEVHPNHMTNEDEAFRLYLEENGWDVSHMGAAPAVGAGAEDKSEKSSTDAKVSPVV